MFSSSSLCDDNDKDAMLKNVKMNKWECFQVLLYAMTRMQC